MTYNCNQEIEKDNEDENLIENPEEVNGINHEECSVVLEVGGSRADVLEDILRIDIVVGKIDQVVWISALRNNGGVVCDDCTPVVVGWVLDVTDGVFPSLHPDLEICIGAWISSPLIAGGHAVSWSKNFGVNCESSNPNEHENVKIFDIFDSLDNKLNLKSELWLDSHVEEDFDNNLNQDN